MNSILMLEISTLCSKQNEMQLQKILVLQCKKFNVKVTKKVKTNMLRNSFQYPSQYSRTYI